MKKCTGTGQRRLLIQFKFQLAPGLARNLSRKGPKSVSDERQRRRDDH